MRLLSEFKEFALRGNVVDLAVGVVIGAGFGKIVSSLVNDIITPLLALFMGGEHFSKLSIMLRPAKIGFDGKEIAPALLLNYGVFIQSIIDFTIIALVIFFVIRIMNRLKYNAQQEASVAAKVIPADVQLLTEIRDALTQQKS